MLSIDIYNSTRPFLLNDSFFYKVHSKLTVDSKCVPAIKLTNCTDTCPASCENDGNWAIRTNENWHIRDANVRLECFKGTYLKVKLSSGIYCWLLTILWLGNIRILYHFQRTTTKMVQRKSYKGSSMDVWLYLWFVAFLYGFVIYGIVNVKSQSLKT